MKDPPRQSNRELALGCRWTTCYNYELPPGSYAAHTDPYHKIEPFGAINPRPQKIWRF
jgi:hypothetical protein